jgi:hypothetical protein
MDLRCNNQDYDDEAENLKKILATIGEKMAEVQSKSLINKGWLITKDVGIDLYLTLHNGWDQIPIFNIDWKITPKGQDHPGMYFLLASFGFQFEFNIYSIHHAKENDA